MIKISKNTRSKWNMTPYRNYAITIEEFNNSDELVFQAYDVKNSPYDEIKNLSYKVKTNDLKLQTFDNNPIYGLISVEQVQNKGSIVNY